MNQQQKAIALFKNGHPVPIYQGLVLLLVPQFGLPLSEWFFFPIFNVKSYKIAAFDPFNVHFGACKFGLDTGPTFPFLGILSLSITKLSQRMALSNVRRSF
jgi:hypothetical protein